jgi:hypothetical protein
MSETPWESSPEDVAQQRAEVLPDADDQPAAGLSGPVRVPWDADPADAAEQHAEVPLDEDDWR